jgi:glycosyltransferase involved in cell wall biosynthesis
MQKSDRLSIVIPTRNRAGFLDHSLRIHIALARPHGVPIYVSDNASTDGTAQVVEKWQQDYEFLFYHRNSEDIGEQNFEVALKYPQSEFVWLTGDSMRIDIPDLALLLERLDSVLDAVVINAGGRVRGVESKVFTSHDDLLGTLGWHMTQMSSLLYNKRIVEGGNFQLFYESNLIQTGVIYEYLSRFSEFKLLWIPDIDVKLITAPGLVKNTWRARTFEIWLGRWPRFVLSLPRCYSPEVKLRTVIDHNLKSRVFSFRKLLFMKRDGIYTVESLESYREVIRLTFGPLGMLRFKAPFWFPNFIINLIDKRGRKWT